MTELRATLVARIVPARNASFSFALALAMSASAAVAAEPAAAYDTTEIAAEFDRQCRSGEFAGVVVVKVHDVIVFDRTCGAADLLNNIPNTRDTRFKIYSTSKFITALTVMRLAELRRIELDAPLARYITEIPEEWSAVTIRQLLNHTSGVPDLTPMLVEAFRSDFPSAMKSVFAELASADRRLESAPGDLFAYNNFGFELLALAISRIEGRPFTDVVQALVFDPAAMATASFQPTTIELGHPTDVHEEGLAIGYNGQPEKLQQATNWAFIQQGAGAIRAAAADFIALDKALTKGDVISSASLAAMSSDLVAPPGNTPLRDRQFGLGVFVIDDGASRVVGHTGGTNGYISDFQRFPDDGAMMIALTNRGFAKTAWLRKAVSKMLDKSRRASM